MEFTWTVRNGSPCAVNHSWNRPTLCLPMPKRASDQCDDECRIVCDLDREKCKDLLKFYRPKKYEQTISVGKDFQYEHEIHTSAASKKQNTYMSFVRSFSN